MDMKKTLLAIIISLAFVATTVLPGSFFKSPVDAADVTDNLTDASAVMDICNSSFATLQRHKYYSLEDGYFYFSVELSPYGHKGETFHEALEINPYGENSLSGITAIEYKGENDSVWGNAQSDFINSRHDLATNVYYDTQNHAHGQAHYYTYFRVKFADNCSTVFTLQYKAYYTENDAKVAYTSMKYIKVGCGQVMMTQGVNAGTYLDVDPTYDPSQTTTAQPTEVPSEVPTEVPSVEPTEAPTEAPTDATTEVTTTTEKTTTTAEVTTTAKQTTTPKASTNTSDVTTTDNSGQNVKAPGKVTIKKIWKKKKTAKKLKIKIKAVKGAAGYEISVYKNKKNANKGINALVVKYTSKLKYTIKSKKIKNKKKLFVGARAYSVSEDGIMTFGPAAKIKKVKVK